MDLDSFDCFRMVRQPLTPKRVTVEVEKLSTPKKLATPKKEKPRTPKKEQLSPKKEEIHYDENSGQWAEGLSKGVYVHKVCELQILFLKWFQSQTRKQKLQLFCETTMTFCETRPN